jgi:hypothetical protein
MTPAAIVVAIGLAVIVSGCGASPTARRTASGSAGGVVVTRDRTTGPQGCQPRAAAHLVVRFLAAAARDNTDGGVGQFMGPDFKWFSVTGTPEHPTAGNFVAYSRGAVARYITRRDFHVELRELQVAWPTWHGGADIAFNGTWRSAWVIGKGAISCSGTIKVLSMAISPRSAAPARLCPPAENQAQPDAVIACARQPEDLDELQPTQRP